MKTAVSASNITTGAVNTVTVSSPAAVVVKSEIITSNATTAFTAPLSTNTAGINKRPASLDLNKSAPAKKQRTVAPSPLLLESPDLQNMKTLNTPDLEKILLSSQLLQTPQPGTVFPSKVGQVTSEQEEFGKGFEEALINLHNNSKNSQTTQLANNTNNSSNSVTSTVNVVTTTATTGMSGGAFTYTNLAADNSFQATVKVEPQNSANSPPVSPIDMETQEKIKLERKRQRNRVAASKCRKRKLERISKLEDRVKVLKGENSDLAMVVKNLKDHVAQLKQQVMDHITTGCTIPPVNGPLLSGK